MHLIQNDIRDTTRGLKISRQTISGTLKKASKLVNINPNFSFGDVQTREARFERVKHEIELDEQWSFVKKKSNQR